jgi:hypothetical protein
MSGNYTGQRTPALVSALIPTLVILLVACGQEPDVTVDPPADGDRTSPSPADMQVSCSQVNPHPVGQSIADKYNTGYDEVMAWFCSGVAFEDILLALETHELTGMPVDELMASARQFGWDQTWLELGLIDPPGQ